jgi:hypothetical protein
MIEWSGGHLTACRRGVLRVTSMVVSGAVAGCGLGEARTAPASVAVST